MCLLYVTYVCFEALCSDGLLCTLRILVFTLPLGQGIYLVAQRVKNLPALQETWVRSLGWEDPLEKGTVTYSSILAWRIPWRSLVGYSPWGPKESDTTEQRTTFTFTWLLSSWKGKWWIRSQVLKAHCLGLDPASIPYWLNYFPGSSWPQCHHL